MHVERRDDVEGVARKGSGRHGGADETSPARFMADPSPMADTSNPQARPNVLEPCHVRAGSTPAVQQGNVRSAPGSLSEERADEEPEAAKPEMPSFGIGRGAEEMVHAADCTARQMLSMDWGD